MKAIDDLLLQFPFAAVEQNDKIYKFSVPKENIHEVASILKNNDSVPFDFLIDIVGID